MDTDDDLQAYSLPPRDTHPADIAVRLMHEPEHRPLFDAEVQFGWLMRTSPKDKGGKRELGSVHVVKTMFQGGFKDLGLQLLESMLGYLPEFLVVLDAEFWAAASRRDREAVIWHELCHVKHRVDKFGAPKFDRDGLPVFGIVEHDVTAFNSEVARYGTWSPDLREFFAVANERI